MRINLASKITAVVVSVLVLGVLSNALALYSSWRVTNLLHFVLENHLPSVVAGEKMEIALLEHRGLMSGYVLDKGNPSWLAELDQRRVAFENSIKQARMLAFSAEENHLLDEVERIHKSYTELRKQALALYQAGKPDDAIKIMIGPMREQNRLTLEACRAYVAANEKFADQARDDASRQVRISSILIVSTTLLTTVLGFVLMYTLRFGIWRPLERMVADAKEFSSLPLETPDGKPANDLEQIGYFLSALMMHTTGAESQMNRARSQLALSERLASTGRLAASLAHEIRNPLTSMKLWLFSLRTSVGGNEAVDHKLKIVSDEIHRLETVVNNFLDFSRPGALKRSPQSVSNLIEKTLDLVHHRLAERQMTVTTRIDAELPEVMGDLGQLKQVLINLIENAIAAMKPGGTIRIEATVENDPTGEPEAVIFVRDTGTGIPDDVRARIFEPFFSTKEEGAGLGLCIAAQIVAQHNGRLVLVSTGPTGTTFALRLEVIQEPVHG